MTETWRISDPVQLETLVSAVRQDILDTLLSGGPMSVRHMARHLGMKPSALYYHLDELETVGLVSREDRPRVDGRAEAWYRVDHDLLEIEYRPDDPANRHAVTRVVRSALRLADRDFERGFEHAAVDVSSAARNLWGARGKGWLREEDLVRVNELLGELSGLFVARPDVSPDGETLCALTWVLAPVAARPREPR